MNQVDQAIADRIIVALDMATEADAIALIDRLPHVTFVKVGLELFLSAGPSFLRKLKQRNKRIFLDLKLHDIPNTMAGACRVAAKYGVDFLTIHAPAGRVALEAAQSAIVTATPAGETPTQLLAVTVLTSISPREFAIDLKVPLEVSDYALQMALMSQECGIPGIVCSPQEVPTLRRACDSNLLLVCPGVRPTWADAGDQKRRMTPAEAFKLGASYLVIGRPIYSAPSPSDAFDRICAEIEAAV